MKKAIVVVFMFFLLFCLVACLDFSKRDENKQIEFVFLYPDAFEDWRDVTMGMEKAIYDYNSVNKAFVNISTCIADGVIDQNDKLIEILSSEVDGICIVMPNMALSHPVEVDDYDYVINEKKEEEEAFAELSEYIKNGIDSGIPILTIGNDQFPYNPDPNSIYHFGTYMEQPTRLCFIGSDNYILGRRIGEKVIEEQNGNARIYLFGGWRYNVGQLDRYQGVKDAVSENADFGACIVDGIRMIENHQYPLDSHGVYYVGKKREGPYRTGDYIDWEQSCICERNLKESISLVERGNIQINTYIGLWKGSNAISNVFRERGWNDTDINKNHLSILCGESNEVINAVKDHYATCAFIEDRYEWGYQAAKTLIDIVCEGVIPETDHIYTPFYILDLSNIYDFYSD